MQQQAAPQAYPPAVQQGAQPDIYSGPSPIKPLPGGRRSDVFDPNENPNAPGAPRQLGQLPVGQPSAPQSQIMKEEAVGARGGREAGAPLDLSTLQGGSQAMPQQQRGPSLASATPAPQTPKEQYDLGYSYIQRKDFAQAEETHARFRAPLSERSPDRRTRITGSAKACISASVTRTRRNPI